MSSFNQCYFKIKVLFFNSICICLCQNSSNDSAVLYLKIAIEKICDQKEDTRDINTGMSGEKRSQREGV